MCNLSKLFLIPPIGESIDRVKDGPLHILPLLFHVACINHHVIVSIVHT
jgi:hypothetical protein